MSNTEEYNEAVLNADSADDNDFSSEESEPVHIKRFTRKLCMRKRAKSKILLFCGFSANFTTYYVENSR